MILDPVSRVTTTAMEATSSATVCASPDVLGGLSGQRHTVSITAKDADVYFGGEDVTTDTGVKVAAGETVYIPVSRKDAVYYVGGAFVLGEFF